MAMAIGHSVVAEPCPTGGLVDHALAYAALGWAVFPLRPKDKRPLIARDAGGRGCLDATTDQATIRGWWWRTPSANIGVACGPSGIVVLDIDGEEGAGWLEQLIAEHDVLPDHPFSLTRSGGHVVFRSPPAVRIANAQGRPAPKLDVRAAGGYIVAPPSIHPSGHVYCWEPGRSPWETAPPPMPGWLLGLVAANDNRAAASSGAMSSRPDRRSRTEAGHGATALHDACQRIATAPDGQQQSTLTAESYRIGRLVGQSRLEAAGARTALIAAGMAMPSYRRDRWTPEEIARQVDRKLAEGQARAFIGGPGR
jgi:hypothetical protein